MKAGAFCILKTSHHKAHRVFSNPCVFVATSEMLQALIYALCSDTSTSHWLWSSKVRSSLVCCFKGSRSTHHQLLSLGWVIVLTLFLWREKNNERTVVLFFFFPWWGRAEFGQCITCEASHQQGWLQECAPWLLWLGVILWHLHSIWNGLLRWRVAIL